MVFLRNLDEVRVQVHSDDGVPALGEPPADPPGAAARIEDPRAAFGHRVDESGFAVDVLTGFRDATPPLRVVLRMLRVARQRFSPEVPLSRHASVSIDQQVRGTRSHRGDRQDRRPRTDLLRERV